MWFVPSKPECYGKMFPENGADGYVFAKSGHALTVNVDQWHKCEECHWYRFCYDLGIAKKVLKQAQGEEVARSTDL
jgi:hypothetical protein